MKTVEFDDQDYIPRGGKRKKRKIHKNNESELVSWVINKGWIKNKSIISIIFILISLIFIFLSIVFFTGGEVFGFSDKFNSRSNQPYYISIPGVEGAVLVKPNENLSDVVERHSK